MPPLDITDERLTREDTGYHKGLHSRQLQMIALGGAIGTGLFLGAGGRLASAGPGLFLVYGICGIFVFLILRALGELVLHRPSSGSFVSYAREFYGEKVAFVAGWMYFLNWAMTGIVDTTAIAHYCHYWRAFQPIPQWTLALIALLVVLSMNLISVRLFGELEFWASLIKVIALVTFLIVGTVFLAGRYKIDGQETGVSLWSSHGGIVPTGLLPIVLVTSGVVFAYAAIELVGIAAGETAEPAKIMPRAINSVVLRIACFYVGSTVLLALLLPYTAYKEHVSPFVTFFSKIGIDAAGSVMNLVVLTAALSSLNAGLYSTGRILRSMAINGSGPRFTAPMSKTGVPYGGDPAHRRYRPVGHHSQRHQTEPSLRDRAPHRRDGSHRGLGDDRGLPAAAPPDGERRAAAAAEIPDAAFTVQRLSDAGFPGRRADPDVLRRTTRSLDDRRNGDRCTGPHRWLVFGPQSCDGRRAPRHRPHQECRGRPFGGSNLRSTSTSRPLAKSPHSTASTSGTVRRYAAAPCQTAAGYQGTAKDSSHHLGIDIGRVDHMQDGVVGVLAVGLGQTRTH